MSGDVRTGQLREWLPGAESNVGMRFLVVGFKEWDDCDPTVILLERGTMFYDFYTDYVNEHSKVVGESLEAAADVIIPAEARRQAESHR